jgi:hypothetical protein
MRQATAYSTQNIKEIGKMKRWIATLTSYEPDHASRRWGRGCIKVRYTDAALGSRSVEIPAGMGIQTDAAKQAEKTGEVFYFFTSDIDWRDLASQMPEEWFY